MAKQLVYTSVPEGLWPGTSGYCTVLSTEGIPRVQAEYLEKLSVFRIADRLDGEVISPTQDNYERLLSINPSNLSHIKFRFRNHEENLLLKTCLAGFDYSSRLRKLSHFLLLSDSDQSAAGPVWLAQQPSVFLGNWGGQPNLLKQEKDLPRGSLAAAPCRTWQAVMGDAGWAGVLAQSVMRGDGQPVYIIADATTDVTQLLLEASALLPNEKRWDVTFSTRYVNFTQGVTCQWRCVAPGSPEALEAVRGSANLIIDTLNPTTAPASKEAAAARQGQQLAIEARVATVFTADFPLVPEPVLPTSADPGVTFVPVDAQPPPADETGFYYPTATSAPATSHYSQPAAETAHEPLPQTGRLRLPVEKPPVEPTISRPPPLTSADLPPTEPPIGYSSTPAASPVSTKIVIVSLLIVACAGLLGGAGFFGVKKLKEIQTAKQAAFDKQKQDEANRKALETAQNLARIAAEQQQQRINDEKRIAAAEARKQWFRPPFVRPSDDMPKGWIRVNDLWAKEIAPLPNAEIAISIADVIENPRRHPSKLRIVHINGTPIETLRTENGCDLQHGRITVDSALGTITYKFSDKKYKFSKDDKVLEKLRLGVANGIEGANDAQDPDQFGDAAIAIAPMAPPKITKPKEREPFEHGQELRLSAAELNLGELRIARINDQDVTASAIEIAGVGKFEISEDQSLKLIPDKSQNDYEPKSYTFRVAGADSANFNYPSNTVEVVVKVKGRDFTPDVKRFLDSLDSEVTAFGHSFLVLKLPPLDESEESPSVILGKFPVPLESKFSLSLERAEKVPDSDKLELKKESDGWHLSLASSKEGGERSTVAVFQLKDGELRFQWRKGDFPADQVNPAIRRNAMLSFLKVELDKTSRFLRFPPHQIPANELTFEMFDKVIKDAGMLSKMRSWGDIKHAKSFNLVVDKKAQYFDADENPDVFKGPPKVFLQIDDKTPQMLHLLNPKRDLLDIKSFDAYKALYKGPEGMFKPQITFKLDCGVVGELKPRGGNKQAVLFAVIKPVGAEGQ